MELLELIVSAFVESADFNGASLAALRQQLKLSESRIREEVAQLVSASQVTLAFASQSENPHIKRLPDPLIEEQLNLLSKERLGDVCAYPSAEMIRERVSVEHLNNQPFTQRLALAEAQLTAVYFDLSVLERYQRDPRYRFEFHDYSGSISMASEYYDSPDVRPRDKILLDTFGIGYDSRRRRVALSFLRYLSKLSSEHQQFWASHIVDDTCTSNSDYINAAYYGAWPKFYSAYEAFLQERREINKLAELIGKPPLFVDEWVEKRPPNFHAMLRPTRQQFFDFVLLLDKLLSENINKQFFVGDVPLERHQTRRDGTLEVVRPGTLTLLEQWLSERYKDAEGTDVAREVLAPLREVRKLRQQPAHGIQSDEHDEQFPIEQDALLGRALRALTRLRLILWSHPKARKQYEPPQWLDSDRIVFY